MRKVVVVLSMAAVAATGVFAVGGPSGASVAAKDNKKLCKILTDVQIDPSTDVTGEGGKENAEKFAKKLNQAAKKAPKSIKKTLKTLAKYFNAIADEDTDAIADQAEAYGKAITKYATYVTTSCLADALDDLPDGVDIPDITLPGS